MIRALIDRVLLNGYERAKQDGVLDVIARFARGNTAAQTKRIIDEVDIPALRRDGERAFKNLANAERRHRTAR